MTLPKIFVDRSQQDNGMAAGVAHASEPRPNPERRGKRESNQSGAPAAAKGE